MRYSLFAGFGARGAADDANRHAAPAKESAGSSLMLQFQNSVVLMAVAEVLDWLFALNRSLGCQEEIGAGGAAAAIATARLAYTEHTNTDK